MKTRIALLLAGLAALGVSSLPALADDPLKKPTDQKPKAFEELSRDPEYENAKLIAAPPESPLATQARFEEHKRAMHLKALKRSGLDNPDLHGELEKLTTAPGVESSFQKVGFPDSPTKHELTIFRFTNFDAFINDSDAARRAAIALGKALFWDPRFSSDRKIACASCHYNAGADHRTRGVVRLPNNLGTTVSWPDFRNPEPPTAPTAAAPHAKVIKPYALSSVDLIAGSPAMEEGSSRGVFDPGNASGFQMREVIGSLGIRHRKFLGLAKEGEPLKDENSPEYGVPMKVGNEGDGGARQVLLRAAEIATTHRQVTPRNAGTTINAVFNARNFHDSRASQIFNGRTNWGIHENDDVNKALHIFRAEGASLSTVSTWTALDAAGKRNPYFIANASLASQAVGPIISDVEMSYRGRMFHHIARRMLNERMLLGQAIAPDDSSLSPYGAPAARKTYRELIELAFKDAWWKSVEKVKLPKEGAWEKNADGSEPPLHTEADCAEYSLMEANFSLFWGLALHIYESTLVSDESPFDVEQRFAKSSERVKRLDTLKAQDSATAKKSLAEHAPLSAAARRGRDLFRTVGCTECHGGAEFTSASLGALGILNTKGERLFPDLLNDDGDIFGGQVACPPNKPIGVECMDFGGRMESIYDGGNYVIGVSRYQRKPSEPNSPAISGGAALAATTFDETKTLNMEDDGVGAGFFPSELPPLEEGETTSSYWREQYMKYLNTTKLGDVSAAEWLLDHVLGKPAPEVITPETMQSDVQRIVGFDASEATRAFVLKGLEKALPLARLQFRKGVHLNSSQQMSSPAEYKQQQQQRQAPDRALQMQQQQQQQAPLPAPAAEPFKATDEVAKKMQLDLGFFSAGANAKPFSLVTPHTKVPRTSLARRFQPGFENAQTANPKTDLTERVADAGAFKVPTLRNVELTGPYMHNGSLLTLEAVMDFYARGGHYGHRIRANEEDVKTGDLHPAMAPLALSTEDKADLVEFLKSLTDKRVRQQTGPFDHPELKIPLVSPTRTALQGNGNDGFAGDTVDAEFTIPATGYKSQSAPPNRSFEETLAGNREH